MCRSFYFLILGWGEVEYLAPQLHMGFCAQPLKIYERMGWNIIGRENPKYSEKTYPSAYLATENPTWTILGLSLGRLHGEKWAPNFLSHGMSCVLELLKYFYFQTDLFLNFILYEYGVFIWQLVCLESNCSHTLLLYLLTNQNYWVFGLCPLSDILESTKHNILETGSVFVLR
jgi:hypothetical protein